MARALLVAAALLLGAAGLAAAQPNDVHQMTTSPPGARYEILQSQLAARWTFRLDRCTGRVDRLAPAANGNVWKRTSVVGLPAATGAARPHFQLFTSGLAARYTFLMDTDTGRTWQVYTSEEDAAADTEIVWRPLGT
jgi:hypothetical protein